MTANAMPRRRAGKPSGRKPLPDLPTDSIRELRLSLGLTQEQVAERSGGKLLAWTVQAVEIGRNKATTFVTQQGLAAGLGLTLDELSELFAEKLSVEDAASRVRVREPGLPPPVATAG